MENRRNAIAAIANFHFQPTNGRERRTGLTVTVTVTVTSERATMGWTSLHTAARDGDIKRLKRCVEDIKWLEPVDVNAQSSQGHTPLHMSAANGHVEAMQYILSQKGVEIDAQTKMGNTSLHLAALNSRDQACRVLVHNGADVKKENKAGKSAVDVCPSGAPELKQYLDVQANKEDTGELMEEDEV